MQRTNGLKNMLNEHRSKEDYTVNLVMGITFILVDSQSGRGGKVGREIRIAQPPVSEGPPGAIGRRRLLSIGRTIIGVFKQSNIVERERSNACTGERELPILASEATRCA